MCGIVGLLIRNETLHKALGEMTLPMLHCMAERGADSAGLAVFDRPLAGDERRFNVFAVDRAIDWNAVAAKFETDMRTTCRLESVDNHAVFITNVGSAAFAQWAAADDRLLLLCAGRTMDLYKDVGHPLEIAERYRFGSMRGSHAIGHTRMATESAISPAHAHPYTAGEDFCLVQNGSLSNPYMTRRMLEAKGLEFHTDNDTEAACRCIEWRLRQGDTLQEAVRTTIGTIDGFYTLLMATSNEMMLVRDAFACKPCVVAETDDYVAVASEYRSLADLPGIKRAKIHEPEPEVIYAWNV